MSKNCLGQKPRYLELYTDGLLGIKVEQAQMHMEKCYLCPHECGTNRTQDLGTCQGSAQALVASYGPHLGEEDVLVGQRGSGTIFFGYCNMRCIYCQNYSLSFNGDGTLVSDEKLADIMLLLQNHYKCHNINLVTPTHFVPNIINALYIAIGQGLKIPLVYNCGGYEKLETLKLLDGIVDIYMPDFKYNDPHRGEVYSQVVNYPARAKLALKEMDRQVGGLKVDDRGIAYRGLLIRHLILPQGIGDTKEVLKFIKKELSPDCLVNLMNQYRPTHRAFECSELAQHLRPSEYAQARDIALKLGLNLT